MMKGLILLLLFISSIVLAEDEVKISAMVDKALATTGDEIVYTIQLEHPVALDIPIPEVGDKIAGFRIVEFGKTDPVKDKDTVTEGRFYKLRADLTGSYILPAVEIQYKDQAGNVKTVKSGEVFVEIESVLNKDNPEGEAAQDIRDIKAIYKSKFDYFTWGGIILAILALAAGIYYWVKRRGQKPEPLIKIPPHEAAMDGLNKLLAHNLDSLDELKAFHFHLSEIMRVYFEAIFSFPATDRTIEEIRNHIGIVSNLDRAHKETFLNILKETDQVKFTDYMPVKERNLELVEESKKFVLVTKPVEKVEEEGIV